MSNWKQVIADAKELLDLGAITPEEFEQAKKEAIELRTQITNVSKESESPENVTLPPSSLSGMGTMVGSPDMLSGVDAMGTYVHQSTITKVGSYVLMGVAWVAWGAVWVDVEVAWAAAWVEVACCRTANMFRCVIDALVHILDSAVAG